MQGNHPAPAASVTRLLLDWKYATTGVYDNHRRQTRHRGGMNDVRGDPIARIEDKFLAHLPNFEI
jgi:hypothetical protein